MINNLKKREILGFTLIEIIIVMAVMSILSTIMIISYSSWQHSSYTSTVKSDLMNAVSAMENARNFSSGYPSSLTGIYTASKDVDLTIASADAKTFCIDASSSKDATILYYVDSQYNKSEPQTGTCAGRPGQITSPTGLSLVAASPTTITVQWGLVSGATGYTLESSKNPSFDGVVSVEFGASPTFRYSSSVSPSTKYYYRVRAFDASGFSAWSSVENATTSSSSIAAPSAPVVSANTVSSTTTYSWPAVSCAAGQKTEYQYQYTITPAGYDSGWVDYGNSLSIAFTTSTEGQDYVLAVQAHCRDADTVGYWSTSGSATYHRPGTWKKLTDTCGIASDDKAYCWGLNDNGQVGNNSTSTSLVPVAVNTSGVLSGKSIINISSSARHSCAVAAGGNAYCWGYNSNGQLGNNSTTQSLVPVAVNTTGVLSGKTVKTISAGQYHTCAIASDNNAYCWGYNSNGQLGNNSTTQSLVPVAVNTTGVLSGKTVKSISAMTNFTCAIASDDKVYCWGVNTTSGLLGNNSTTQSLVPVAVNTTGVLSGKTIKKLSNGIGNACVVASDDKAYCWGVNLNGQLGNNSTTDSLVPVAVNTAGVLSGKIIADVISSTCAITSEGKAYCWGPNVDGQLGDGTNTRSLVPVAVNTAGVLSGKTLVSISFGIFSACALDSDKNAYCWGYNYYGQLGNNSTTSSNVPVKVNAPF